MELLRRAGWNEERRVDTQDFERIIKECGFEVFDVQRDFLSRFGGLHLPNSYRAHGMHFDLEVAQLYPEEIEGAAEALGTKLSPIGELNVGHELMAMAPDGKVYYVYEDYFRLLGNSAEEVIEDRCTR